MAGEIEPELIVEADAVYHERVAVPMADRIAVPGGIEFFGVFFAVHEDLPIAVDVSFKEEDEATVEVSTLDDEFKDSPGVLLIKLDTQGTELNVLKGGIEMLRKTRFVLTEMDNHQLYKNACQYYEVDDFLRNRSFKLVDIIVSYRGDDGMAEFDALYENVNL